ncbi:MAG: hypothetical protein ACRD0Y_10335, partial [Terriglobales bacterium]
EQVTRRELYRDCFVGEIRATRGQELCELRAPGEERFLGLGEEFGGVDPLAIRRQMIRRTIQEHLAKQVRLRPLGIKVLSLFFVDRVEKYRRYDDDGSAHKGEYATMFEEEYTRLAAHPDFRDLFTSAPVTAAEVHDGYFSMDRASQRWRDTRGESQADESAYALILRDKEKLLSFTTPLQFIFSHSALREGWDNPNVFQVCALRDIAGEVARRQSIGRGLRLAVNQEGERVRGPAVNTLTVVATESYEQFASGLQHELSETGIQFGVVADFQFAGIQGASAAPMGYEASRQLWQQLADAGYLSASGHVEDALRQALSTASVRLPGEFEPQRAAILAVLRKAAGRLDIKNADEHRVVRTRQAVLDSADFLALWERIKHKTTYRVHFDNAKLIEACTQALANAPTIPRARLQWTTAGVKIEHSGVRGVETSSEAPAALEEHDIPLPDPLTELQVRTQLTRRSLARILINSGRLTNFRDNPQQFLAVAAEVINHARRLAIVDGIRYQRLGNDAYSVQELFCASKLIGYLKHMVPATRCVYEEVVTQSEVEKRFADQLEKNTSVKVYAKLPAKFQIATPLGPYNPDWAALIERDGRERLYFVVETKAGLFADDLRGTEAGKIACGKAHFAALASGDNPARFLVATSLDDLLAEN